MHMLSSFRPHFPSPSPSPSTWRSSSCRGSPRPYLLLPRASPLRPGETPEQALERRMRESERVEERVVYISSSEEWDAELEKAGQRLIVLEMNSDEICQTGFDEEPELHWKDDIKKALEPCRNLKHTFQRVARDCPDVVFLAAEGDSDQGQELCDTLGIDVLPTLQFWREGKLLWEHRGVVQLDTDLSEGVLYFGDSAGNNIKASMYVQEVGNREELQQFLESIGPQELAVVDVSSTDAAPCVHIFPAVLALARSFKGYAAFARLMGDANEEATALMADLGVTQVPTFLFFRGGELVGRHVGSSRGDLIGQILSQQAAAGVQPPPPPPKVGTKRRRRRSEVNQPSSSPTS